MKFQTELVLLFFVLSCSVLTSSVHGAGAVKYTGGSVIAQQQDDTKIPEKNKEFAKKVMAMDAQRKGLGKPANGCFKGA